MLFKSLTIDKYPGNSILGGNNILLSISLLNIELYSKSSSIFLK